MKTATFKNYLISSLDENKKDHAEHNQLMKALKPLVGQSVTNNRVLKLLPTGWEITGAGIHKTNNSFSRLEVKSPTDKKHSICSRSEQRTPFSIEDFLSVNTPYGTGAKDRIEKLETILQSETEFNKYLEHYRTAKKIVKLTEKLKNSILSISFWNPAHHEIIKNLTKKTSLSNYELEDLRKTIR